MEKKKIVIKRKTNKDALNFSPTFSYIFDLIKKMKKNEKLKIYNFYWAGGRFTGKTANALIFCILAPYLLPNKIFRIYLIRKTIKNVYNIFEEFIKIMPIWYQKKNNISINWSRYTIKGKNFKLRGLGLKDSRGKKVELVGLPRGYCDYSIVLLDEAAEYDEEDFSAVRGAIAGQNEKITFFTSNPFFPGCPYFVDFQTYLPWNKKKMIEIGEDFLKIEENNAIYHWTNIIKTGKEGYISEQTINDAYRDAKLGKRNADVILLGKPAVMSDIIFPTERIIAVNNLIGLENKFKNGILRIGIDFGRTKNMSYVWFGLVSKNRESVITLAEKPIIHKNVPYNSHSIQTTIYNFIYKTLQKHGFNPKNPIAVYTDNNEPSLVDNLRLYARIRSGIRFIPINDKNTNFFKREVRITSIKEAMATDNFYIINGKCSTLLRCLNSMKYKRDANDVNRLIEDPGVGFNDPFDAMCYGLFREISSRNLGKQRLNTRHRQIISSALSGNRIKIGY